MDFAEKVATGVVTGVITIAVLAVLLSSNSHTPGVLTGAGNAFSQVLTAAEGPSLPSGYSTPSNPEAVNQ